jgi:hypothetical protein
MLPVGVRVPVNGSYNSVETYCAGGENMHKARVQYQHLDCACDR